MLRPGVDARTNNKNMGLVIVEPLEAGGHAVAGGAPPGLRFAPELAQRPRRCVKRCIRPTAWCCQRLWAVDAQLLRAAPRLRVLGGSVPA